METELLKQLVSDPAHWPLFLVLSIVVIFIVKFVGVMAEAAAKRVWTKAKDKKGLLSFCRFVAQVIAVAIVMYIANALYWHHNIKRLIPEPTQKAINSCETTVEIVIESEDRDKTYRHFIDRGGYLAFGRGDKALLVASSSESWGGAIGTNEYTVKGVFKMSMTDTAAGRPAAILIGAEYAQLNFPRLPKEYRLVKGKAICVINSELRFEIVFPSQTAKDGNVYVRDLKNLKEFLK